MYSGLNCHNVAKHAEFYVEKLRFNVTSAGNAGCFKKSFANWKAYINSFRGYVQWF
jgi:hypothetical protein